MTIGSSQMYAIRAHSRGGPEVLVYELAPRPTASAGEVVVEVSAAAITFAELTWEETWTRGGVDRTPTIPSHEFCGVVTELGSGVTGVSVGDEVYGLVPFDRDGAAAEAVAVPVGQLAAKPRSLSAVEAAALPLPALTAQQALFDHAKVVAGERVLILGGAGGVGGYAVQMAVSAGAHVIATSVGEVDYVRGLGAHEVIDVRSGDVADLVAPVDCVIDTVGGDTLDRAYALLRRGGRLVTLQTPPDLRKAEQFCVDAIFFIVATDSHALTRLADLVDSSALRVTVAATFPLVDGRAAYASGAGRGRAPGKTVLIARSGHGNQFSAPPQ